MSIKKQIRILPIFLVLLFSSCQDEVPVITNAQIVTPVWLHGHWNGVGNKSFSFFVIDSFQIWHREPPTFLDALLGSEGYEFRCQLELDFAISEGNLYGFTQETEGTTYELSYLSNNFDKSFKFVLKNDTLTEHRKDDKNNKSGTYQYMRR